ncbi:laccase, multicopper oxidase, benzenediol:oxygen oxidorectuctase [Marasmius tenuissimus]|nr:laccase, multicopper oxidase, benzenediol:oxygen oxidorectuctase [Marasmius tenuissimus]
MSRLTSFVFLACLFARQSFAAIGPVADLVISNKDVSPDGFTRGAVVAGDSTIGPLIVGNKNDNFKLNVINNLNDNTMLQSTSIHWHGFFMKDTSWADGPAFVTQCPISKGHSFLYDFHATNQAGTFWYHSHLSTQYCDGLRGPMVVYDPQDPHASRYDVDDESTVITLADWYHVKAKGLANAAPVSTLINGLGRWNQGDANAPLSIINVEQGKRYRFRVVNVACSPNYNFFIEGHSFDIIEADSVSHEVLHADSVRIFAGQRYSLIMEANQPVGNYWIRANPTGAPNGFVNGINSAILRYAGAPVAEPPVTNFESTAPMNEAQLRPLTNPGAPGSPTQGGADVAMHLNFAFSGGRFTLNGKSFVPPTVPVLLQILSGAQSADNLLPEGMVFPLPKDKTVELSFNGGLLGIQHPMHLHGHAFDVVRVAGSSTYNYENPVRRDVVSLGTASDNVTIRFRTDNPGPWFMHCHIDWHMESGFAVVFAERTDEWASLPAPPSAWNDLCPTYNALDPADH